MLAGLRRVVVILTRLFQTKIQCRVRHLASRDLAIMAALELQSLLHMLKNGFLPPLLEANEHLVKRFHDKVVGNHRHLLDVVRVHQTIQDAAKELQLRD